MLAALLCASVVGCLPKLEVTANQECFFGSTTAALHALETASRESGCSMVDGECTCPTEQPDRSVCGNWATNLLRYYRPQEGDDDFVKSLSENLAATCRTYGGLLLQENPPAEVRPSHCFAAQRTRARCQHIFPPGAGRHPFRRVRSRQGATGGVDGRDQPRAYHRNKYLRPHYL
jgi:hypothetical protein